MERIRREVFEQYIQARFGRDQAITPGQRLETLRQLRAEAGQGVVPNGYGTVARLNTDDPRVQAVIAGEPVSVGGESAQAVRPSGVAGLPLPVKIAVLAAIVIVPFLLYLIVGVVRSAMRPSAPEPTAAVVAATPEVQPTSTPTPVALEGSVAAEPNDPASLELAGQTFVLSVGQVKKGTWLPAGAEWLKGTELRRVLAVPYTPELATEIQTLPSGASITLRLRSGEIVTYTLTNVLRASRYQIEILSSLEPSIVIVLFDEPETDQRWAIFGRLSENVPLALP